MVPAAARQVDGLDYRFDITHSNNVGFIDDTYSRLSNVSGQLNYRVTDNFKIWGAAEYKQDKDRFYWGTPLVPANAPGIVPTSGIVSGLWTNYYLNGHTGTLNPVTIDARTLTTNFNVLNNHSGAEELWLRSGFQWDITNNISLRSQVYGYDAHRHWFNNEISSFDDSGPNNVYRERLALDHAQRLYGNVTDLTINSNIGGMENRFVTTVAASSQQFNVSQDTLFFSDTVNLINPDRGLYGPRSDEKIYTHLDKASLSFEDRLKVTSNFALIGGIRFEDIELSRTRFSPAGVLRSDRGYPFSTTFNPITGRVGYTWEAVPGSCSIASMQLRPTQRLPTSSSWPRRCRCCSRPREPMRRASSCCLPTSGWNSSCRPSISSARTSMFRKAGSFSTSPARLHRKVSKSPRRQIRLEA